MQVIRGNGNNWVKLGQCAKKGSHNGPKCLTATAEHFEMTVAKESEGTTDVISDLQPTSQSVS